MYLLVDLLQMTFFSLRSFILLVYLLVDLLHMTLVWFMNFYFVSVFVSPFLADDSFLDYDILFFFSVFAS